jgi:hypothetical protein
VLVELGQGLAEINQRNNELLDLTEQVIALLPADARKQLAFANQQALWSQRMAKNANALLSSDQINPETAYQLGQDLRTFREVLDGLLKGSGGLGRGGGIRCQRAGKTAGVAGRFRPLREAGQPHPQEHAPTGGSQARRP